MKEKILDLVSEYCNEEFKPKPFNPKTDRISAPSIIGLIISIIA